MPGCAKKVNDVFEWYHVDIDGVWHVFGILEILNAIDAVNKFELDLKNSSK